jgi:hypothetical protein
MSFSPRLPVAAVVASTLMATPALAAEVTPFAIFSFATIPMKLMMVALVVATIAAVVITIRKIGAGQISGGSTYLASLRLGGPLVGLLGTTLHGLWSFLGILSVGRTAAFEAFVPGLAEALLVMSLGLIAGVVAVICHWAVEARVDRMVLKA